jgi:sortase A
MNLRRLLALLLIVAGMLLCGTVALHAIRGFEAQTAGRRVLEERRAARRPSADNPERVLAPTNGDRQQLYRLGQPIARLRIPSARIDAIVFEGSEPDILEKGPGHVPGTELPGRRSGLNNCVITAHRDSHFRNLGWLRKGHRIELETPESEESYRVVSREIVDPSAVRVLLPTSKRRLTLITCYPFNFIGPAPQRLVVVAEPETRLAGS